MARLCLDADGNVDHQMYLALRTNLSLDDALDLIEIQDVGASARAAALRNQDEINRRLATANRELTECR